MAHMEPGGVTSIVTCAPCVTPKERKKGTFLMIWHDTCELHLGYQNHEKSEKKGSKIDMLNLQKGYVNQRDR